MVGWYIYKNLKQAELTYAEKNIRTMVVYRRMEEKLARMGIKLSGILEIFQILTIVSVTQLHTFAKLNLKIHLQFVHDTVSTSKNKY